MQTIFTPQQHGYQFRNRFEGAYPQLCGGMSFGSLDYYYSGLPIPTVAQAPHAGDPIYDYIVLRQLDAHAFAIPALIEGRSTWGPNTRRTGVTHAYAAVKSWIDRGSPVPVLLGDLDEPLSTNSHWVVATGYEDGDGGTMAAITLYDNNYPNQRCSIRPSDGAGRPSFIHSMRNRQGQVIEYGFFVPYLEYRPQDPRRDRDPGWALRAYQADI